MSTTNTLIRALTRAATVAEATAVLTGVHRDQLTGLAATLGVDFDQTDTDDEIRAEVIAQTVGAREEKGPAGPSNPAAAWVYAPVTRAVSMDEPTSLTLTLEPDAHPLAVILLTSVQQTLAAAVHLDTLDQIGAGDLYYALNDVRRHSGASEAVTDALILAHRDAGASWGQLGAALDIDRQSAKRRFLTLDRRRTEQRDNLTDEGTHASFPPVPDLP